MVCDPGKKTWPWYAILNLCDLQAHSDRVQDVYQNFLQVQFNSLSLYFVFGLMLNFVVAYRIPNTSFMCIKIKIGKPPCLKY